MGKSGIIAILAAFILGACGVTFPEETGAPPRPILVGQKIEVRIVADAELQNSIDARVGKEQHQGTSFLAGRAIMSYARSVPCVIEITDRPMTAEGRSHLIEHEKRHCTGQQHVWRGNTLVWLP